MLRSQEAQSAKSFLMRAFSSEFWQLMLCPGVRGQAIGVDGEALQIGRVALVFVVP